MTEIFTAIPLAVNNYDNDNNNNITSVQNLLSERRSHDESA